MGCSVTFVGGKVREALSAMLSVSGAFRRACCWPLLARGLRCGVERVSWGGVTRAGGERLICGVGLPGPAVGELTEAS